MKPTEGDLPAALQQAQAIVAEQLTRLRAVADAARARQAALAVEARAAERALDEAATQLLFAASHNQFKAGLLGRKEAQLRERYDAITREVEANERALRELAQLVRQIEMSSAGLGGGADSSPSDPWAQALRAQVIQGREEERVRLAREVHDGPAQVLANTLMGLAVCQGLAPDGNPKLAAALDRLHSATQEGLSEVRRFIAAQISQRGLSAAIGEYVRGHQNAYGTQVAFEAEPLPRLAPEAEIVIYRIVQEALQNAHKHARGARVVIRLTCSANQLRLAVRDDGPGFDPRSVLRRAGRESWGLTSMRERAELIGAQLAVASRPGYGTEITLTLQVEV
jgi:two-component system, NarL family, sensor histidine kinase DegS